MAITRAQFVKTSLIAGALAPLLTMQFACTSKSEDKSASSTSVQSGSQNTSGGVYYSGGTGKTNGGSTEESRCVTPEFEFTMPDPWRETCQYSTSIARNGHYVASIVYKGQLKLAEISYMDGPEPLAAGDAGNQLCHFQVAPDGAHHSEVWVTNWPWIIAKNYQSYAGYGDELLEGVLGAVTGGKWGLRMALNARDSWESLTTDAAAYVKSLFLNMVTK